MHPGGNLPNAGGLCPLPTGPHRNSRGQFVRSESPQCRIVRNRESRAASRSIGNDLFTRLFRVVTHTGTEKDWLPSRVGAGPLPRIVSKLFKKKFAPPPMVLAEISRRQYFGVSSNMTTSDRLPRMNVFAADDTQKKMHYVRVYKNLRLAKIRYCPNERRSVRHWVSYALDRGVLRENDPEKALSIVQDALETCTVIDGKVAYFGYPVTVSQEAHGTGRDSRRASRVEAVGEAVGEAVDATAEISLNASSGTAILPMTGSEDDRIQRLYTASVLKTARNTKLFNFFCRVQQDPDDSKLFVVASTIKRCIGEEGLATTPLMIDVLEYAEARCTGVTDAREHVERKKRIFDFVDDLKRARLFLDGSSYGDTIWDQDSALHDNGVEGREQVLPEPELQIETRVGVAPENLIAETPVSGVTGRTQLFQIPGPQVRARENIEGVEQEDVCATIVTGISQHHERECLTLTTEMVEMIDNTVVEYRSSVPTIPMPSSPILFNH